MSFPSYDSYKDSGVAWLGAVPEHWNVKRLKYNLRLFTEKTDRRSNPVGLENIESWSGRFIDTNAVFSGEGVAFERGDILFGKLRPYLAKVYLADAPGEAVGDFHVLKPQIDGRFAQYQLLTREFISIIDGSTYGAKMPRASWDFMGNIYTLSPPDKDEQTAIADFLDRETAKIDALVAEQERLIELLKEKRQATISHAVTKGLNPDAPMKPSGIDWLGDVPEHWDLPKLKHFTYFSGGGTPTRDNLEFWNGDIPWVSPKDMKVERLSDTEERITTKGLESSTANLIEAGRVLMVVRSGILKHTIPVAINLVDVSLNQDMKALKFNKERCTSRFFLLWVQGLNDVLLLAWAKQGATVESIEHFYLAETVMPLPPMNEQIAIENFLDRETAKIDALVNEGKKAIKVLKERRTALISAAVTGKIDVRGLANSKQQEAA